MSRSATGRRAEACGKGDFPVIDGYVDCFINHPGKDGFASRAMPEVIEVHGETERAGAGASTALRVYVACVCAVGAAWIALWPAGWEADQTATTWILVGLAALAGAFPVRFAARRTTFTPTHPFILCALAAVGPLAAVLAGVAGVAGAAVRRRMSPIHLLFNLGAACCSVGAAAAGFALLGATAGESWPALLPSLAAAAIAYFVCNTVLVSIAVALDTDVPPREAWTRTFPWTIAAHFTGMTLAVGLLSLLEVAGPWSLVLGLPPIALLIQFYRSHRMRLEESVRRVAEVEELNRRLECTVGELREALAHVKSLQGLLPICMHCKSIRDDNDIWHRIEAYISEHADVTFTHSLCLPCLEKHYPHDHKPATAKTECSD